MTLSYCVFDTAIGSIGLGWTDRGIARVLLPQRDRQAMERKVGALDGTVAAPPEWVARVVDQLKSYAAGEPVPFDDVPVDLDGVDDFRLAIYDAARRLEFGVTTTYGALAASVGYAGLARETGAALGQNPVPIIIPCHRILAAGNRIGGFSAPGGSATKEKMLTMEGVRVGSPPPAQTTFGF